MDYLILALVGSIIILDTTVVIQSLISQPLISCTIVGYILGDIQLGIKIGFYLQLLWLSSIPVGAAIVPEGNVAAIIISTLIIKHSNLYGNFYTILVCSTIYGVFISYLGGQVVVLYRKTNILLVKKASTNIQAGKINFLNRLNPITLLYHYILFFVLIILSLLLGDICFNIFSIIPVSLEPYFKYGAIAIIGIGIGLVLPIYREKYSQSIIILGIIIGIFIFWIIG